ncbi:MAG TPA: phage late control D family protein [Arcobacter sp.]|nr:phage late control D family protein [Arcobacter sp.]
MQEKLVPEIRVLLDGSKLEKGILGKIIATKVSYSLEKSDMFSITFNDAKLEIQNEKIFDLGKTIIIELGYNSKFTKMIEAEIVQMKYAYESGSSTTLTIIGFDKMFRLSRTKHSRSFKEIKDSEIAREIAMELGLDSDIDATSQKFEYIFQNNQSNLDFLRERARWIDYEVEVEENTLVFKKARHENRDKTVDLIWDRNLMEFHPTIDATKIVSEVEVTGWSPAEKKLLRGIAKAGDEKKSISGEGGASTLKSKFKNMNTKIFKVDIPLRTQDEVDNIAHARLNQLNMEYITAYGLAVGEPKITAGKIVNIKDIGDVINGEYYVVSSEHIFSTQGYKTYFDVKRSVFN